MMENRPLLNRGSGYSGAPPRTEGGSIIEFGEHVFDRRLKPTLLVRCLVE